MAAACANVQQRHNLQIMTPLQLHNWHTDNIKMSCFEHVSLQYKELLQQQFNYAHTPTGT
jgi:hypothetical protein